MSSAKAPTNQRSHSRGRSSGDEREGDLGDVDWLGTRPGAVGLRRPAYRAGSPLVELPAADGHRGLGATGRRANLQHLPSLASRDRRAS